MKVLAGKTQVVSPEIRAPAQARPLSKEEALDILKTEAVQPKRSSRAGSSKGKMDPQELKKLVEDLQKKFDLFSKYLKIEIDHDLDIPVVKIIDKQTNQVVRQIPPEYLLKLMKNIDQMLGILVNQKV